MPTLTPEIIHAAIEGFESQKRRTDSQIDELRQLLHTDNITKSSINSVSVTLPAVETYPVHKKRKVSASARRKMAAAQKARWVRIRSEAKKAGGKK